MICEWEVEVGSEVRMLEENITQALCFAAISADLHSLLSFIPLRHCLAQDEGHDHEALSSTRAQKLQERNRIQIFEFHALRFLARKPLCSQIDIRNNVVIDCLQLLSLH